MFCRFVIIGPMGRFQHTFFHVSQEHVTDQSLQSKQSQMKNNVWKLYRVRVGTCIDWTSFDFRFEDFWAIFYSKKSWTVLLTNQPQLNLEDLSEISSSQISLFWGAWAALEQKLCEEKNSTPIYVQCDNLYRLSINGLHTTLQSRILRIFNSNNPT